MIKLGIATSNDGREKVQPENVNIISSVIAGLSTKSSTKTVGNIWGIKRKKSELVSEKYDSLCQSNIPSQHIAQQEKNYRIVNAAS